MDRVNCIVMEDNIIEFLDEIETQLGKGIVCCKCKNPCEKNTRCAMAMKNLLTDIKLFMEAYQEVNPKVDEQVKQVEPPVEQVMTKTVEKQVLND